MNVPSSHSQLYESGSTEWNNDTSMEDVGRVTWQASQSGSEALNRMLSDAVHPECKKLSRHVLTKAWSPPSDTTTSETSSSSASPLTPAPRIRKQRRRTLGTQNELVTTPSRPSVTSHGLPSSLATNSDALLSLIKEVSHKVNEDTDAKRRAMERALMKARLKEREREKQMMRKIQDNRARIRQTAAAVLSLAHDASQGWGLTRQHVNDVPMDLDEDAQKMPPPPNLPAHRIRPASSNPLPPRSSASEAQAKKPLPVNILVSSGKADTSSAVVRASTLKSAMSGSEPAPSSSISLSSQPLEQKSIAPTIAYEPSAEPSPPSSSVPSMQRMIVPLGPLPTQPKARSRPPVLGMRRVPSSSQSSSQGPKIWLPSKQKQFKTPFAIPTQHVMSSTSGPRIDSHSASTSVSPPCASHAKVVPVVGPGSATSRIGSHPTSFASAETLSDRKSNIVSSGSLIGSLQSNTPFTIASKNTHENGRSSSPPAEANDSFTSVDFDMGIDSDELEKACSAYD